jgi:hypothetical protein
MVKGPRHLLMKINSLGGFLAGRITTHKRGYGRQFTSVQPLNDALSIGSPTP